MPSELPFHSSAGRKFMSSTSDEKIDFVLTWVDPSDPGWQREKAKYQEKVSEEEDSLRYRDWGTLRYWFRGVEKFAPWVNSIYFVTCGQVPSWLDTDNPKLKLVNHADYIPSKYLPTFSSNAIDLNFHRIPSLSEHFVRFDDDMFLTSAVKPGDFFLRGLPRAVGVLDAGRIGGIYRDGEKVDVDRMFFTPATDVALINRNFEKKRVIALNPGKWFSPRYGIKMIKNLLLLPFGKFSAFESCHLPYPYLKSSFEEVWAKEGEVLDGTCSHRFRVGTDANHWLICYWQLCEGKFVPRNLKDGRSFSISDAEKDSIIRAIGNGSYKMVCLNDCYTGNEFEVMRESIISAFDTLLGEKCSFEK